MRIPRIYTAQELITGQLVCLEPEPSNHLARVLRFGTGDSVRIFNSHGGEFQATIAGIDKKAVTLAIGAFQPENHQSPLNTHIVVGVSKGDKMDLIMQKCTELGATAITPVITERSDVKINQERWQKKMEHWRSVCISACEQSGRNLLPKIHDVQPFCTWLDNQTDDHDRYIFHPGSGSSLQDIAPTSAITLCFGSEGGFSDNEISAARKAGFKVIGLGSRILRAETAPLCVLSIVQANLGDLGNNR